MNYTTTKKELLVVVFVIDKFCSYLVGDKIIIYINQAAIRYLLRKKGCKSKTTMVDLIAIEVPFGNSRQERNREHGS